VAPATLAGPHPDEHDAVVLYLVAILAIVAWAAGVLALPDVRWYQHILLVIGLVAIAAALRRRRATG
jgi:hypothetical protein